MPWKNIAIPYYVASCTFNYRNHLFGRLPMISIWGFYDDPTQIMVVVVNGMLSLHQPEPTILWFPIGLSYTENTETVRSLWLRRRRSLCGRTLSSIRTLASLGTCLEDPLASAKCPVRSSASTKPPWQILTVRCRMICYSYLLLSSATGLLILVLPQRTGPSPCMNYPSVWSPSSEVR